MSEAIRALLPWVLVPGVLVMVPMVALRARWGTRSRNGRFVKVLVSAAAMMTLTVPAIGGILDDQLNLVGVQTLVCDSIAIYLSRQAALAIWEETSGSSRGGKYLNAGLTALSAVGVAALVIAYVGMHQSGLSLLLLTTESLQPPALLFWVTFCLVHGTNMAFALGRAIQARSGKLGPVNRLDRASLTWWIVASTAIWVYILNFPAALALIAAGRSDHFVVVNTQLLQALPGLVGSIAGGICAVTWADAGTRFRHSLLRPAWAWCTRTEQDVVLYPFMHTPGHRLSRRRTEVSLATDRLLASTTAAEREQVRSAVEQGTVRAQDHWGVLLHAGRRARLEGRSPQALSPGETLPPGPDSLWQLQRTIVRRRHYGRLQAEVLQQPLLAAASTAQR
ncbi:hypothetical protein CLV92_11930 [Kineococcus xinjiangensis]|uniref:Uncharacterized protein n=1 Tax=Kineococcus xinjiangensis TaxID=512762 RepID=A0A2S6ICM0_9ACTN|nr:hypothetical protein [Kineococcus xinjiangensis]PPK91949.1 hypothetical protein CLV92_11930 [Kineococcus xinjiangensis]